MNSKGMKDSMSKVAEKNEVINENVEVNNSSKKSKN